MAIDMTASGVLGRFASSTAVSNIYRERVFIRPCIQSVRGLYNEIDNGGKYLDIVGCGTSGDRRKNAYALDKQGNGA